MCVCVCVCVREREREMGGGQKERKTEKETETETREIERGEGGGRATCRFPGKLTCLIPHSPSSALQLAIKQLQASQNLFCPRGRSYRSK